MATNQTQTRPAIVVIFGDEEYQKHDALRRVLDRLLPPTADRGMALSEYDGTRPSDQGGPDLATIMDDLGTLPLLAQHRMVLIRDADKFVGAYREQLERYLKSPSPTATLILVCRSFPKTTRLYKRGGPALQVTECKKLTTRGLIDFAIAETRSRKKRIDHGVAARLAELVGPEQGILAAEVEKLCLYAGDREKITADDLAELVGSTREEKIFAVMDAAASGRLPQALELWHQVVVTDPAAVFKAVGGLAFVVRRWLAAQRMLADGVQIRAIAPKLMMWGREQELHNLLRRLSPPRLKRLLAAIADLDAQAKVGARSIETGVEALLIEVATPAA